LEAGQGLAQAWFHSCDESDDLLDTAPDGPTNRLFDIKIWSYEAQFYLLTSLQLHKQRSLGEPLRLMIEAGRQILRRLLVLLADAMDHGLYNEGLCRRDNLRRKHGHIDVNALGVN
jgi:hypothetical protein